MMPPLNAWPPLRSIFWRIKLSRKYWIILSSQPIPLPCHHTYMCICPFISFTSFPFPIQLFNQPFKCNLMYCIHWSYQVIHTEQTKCSLEYNLMDIPIQSVWVNLSFHFVPSPFSLDLSVVNNLHGSYKTQWKFQELHLTFCTVVHDSVSNSVIADDEPFQTLILPFLYSNYFGSSFRYFRFCSYPLACISSKHNFNYSLVFNTFPQPAPIIQSYNLTWYLFYLTSSILHSLLLALFLSCFKPVPSLTCPSSGERPSA